MILFQTFGKKHFSLRSAICSREEPFTCRHRAVSVIESSIMLKGRLQNRRRRRRCFFVSQDQFPRREAPAASHTRGISNARSARA